MGGMLAYAHGQTQQGNHDFKGVITIGSPATFEYSKSQFARFKGFAPRNVFFRINLRSFLENNSRLTLPTAMGYGEYGEPTGKEKLPVWISIHV